MEKVQKLMRDVPGFRWLALILLAGGMFFAYMFVDVLSPLQELLESQPYNWTAANFGLEGGSEFFLNVFALFLIFAGIILDKKGVRFTIVLSGSVMVLGASLKYFAVTPAFAGSGLEAWLNSWWVSMPGSCKLSCLGFMEAKAAYASAVNAEYLFIILGVVAVVIALCLCKASDKRPDLELDVPNKK